jgi:hypothetical protein
LIPAFAVDEKLIAQCFHKGQPKMILMPGPKPKRLVSGQACWPGQTQAQTFLVG